MNCMLRMTTEEIDLGTGYQGCKVEQIFSGSGNPLIGTFQRFYATASKEPTSQQQPNLQSNGPRSAIYIKTDSLSGPGQAFRLAVLITASDSAMYDKGAVHHMGCTWDKRCKEAQHCIQEFPESVDFLWSLARHFHKLRNFHSLTAILQGLKSTGQEDQDHLYCLLDTEGCHQVCRKAFSDGQGIPFMFAEMAYQKYQQASKESLSGTRSRLGETHTESEWDGRVWFEGGSLTNRILVWFRAWFPCLA